MRHGEDRLGQQLGNCAGSYHVSSHLCRADNKHHDSGGLHGIDHQVGPFLDLKLSIHQAGDDQCIQDSQSGSLGSGSDASGDAEDNEHGQADRQKRLLGGLQDTAQAGLGANRVVPLTDMEEPGDHQANADQNTGHNTTQEQGGNRDLGTDTIKDHLSGGRNNGTNAASGADDAGRLGLIVTGAFHDGQHHGANSRGIRHSGTRDACKDHGCQNAHIAQAALETAQHGIGEVHDSAGDAAAGHDLTGDHEEGDRQQGHAVGAVNKLLGQCEHRPSRRAVYSLRQHHKEARTHQREGDGNANDDQAEQCDQKYS